MTHDRYHRYDNDACPVNWVGDYSSVHEPCRCGPPLLRVSEDSSPTPDDVVDDEDIALALRVEDAIRSLDNRLRDDAKWRAAVDQWRRCVREFGANSHAANGALLGVAEVVKPGVGWVHSLQGTTPMLYVAGVLEAAS